MSTLALLMKGSYNISAIRKQIESISLDGILFLIPMIVGTMAFFFLIFFSFLVLSLAKRYNEIAAPVAQVDRAPASGAGCERSSRSRGALV